MGNMYTVSKHCLEHLYIYIYIINMFIYCLNGIYAICKHYLNIVYLLSIHFLDIV
jgi:hypothetical protein